MCTAYEYIFLRMCYSKEIISKYLTVMHLIKTKNLRKARNTEDEFSNVLGFTNNTYY